VQRIGKAAVGKRVAEQQVAVLIMDSGHGHGQPGQDGKPSSDNDEEKCDDRQSLARGEPAKRDSTMRKTFDVRRGRSRARSDKQKPASIVTRSAKGTRINIASLRLFIEGAKYQY